MAARPQNQCLSCGYCWYPRGHNRSPRCPDCGSTSVDFVPDPPPPPPQPASGTPIFLLGGCFLVVVGGIAGLVFLINSARQPNGPEPIDRDAKENEDNRSKSDRRPVALEEAPLPRPAVPLNSVPIGFTSAWVSRGGVQTRLIGATVTHPVLIDAAGKEFTSPDPLLVVWVETRSLTVSDIVLRPWLNPRAEFASIREEKTNALVRAKLFTNGVRVGGRIDGGVKLVPDGPGVIDVLTFDRPASENDLRLMLQGSHLGIGDVEFGHTIPYEVWARK